MSSADDMIIRIRLTGAQTAAAEARGVSASIEGIGKAAKRADAMAASNLSRIGKRFDTTGKKMSAVGKSMTRSFTTPILAAAGASAYLAVNFQQQMELIHTQAGASQAEVGKLSKEILNLAKSGKVAQGPIDLAKALFRLEGVGLRGAKAMRALRASSDLAAVGNANVEDTAKTLAQAWFVGIKGAGSFRDTVAQLNATVGTGDLRLQQLVDALGTGVLASAKQAGLSMQDVTGALAVFGDETNNVSGWAAQFATALHFLNNPGMKAAAAMEAMGLKSTQLAKDMHKPQGLVTALKDLRSHLEQLPGGPKGIKANQLLGNILPGGRGRVLLVLLNQLDRLQQKRVQQQDVVSGRAPGRDPLTHQRAQTPGGFADAVNKTHRTAAFKLHAAWAKVQAILIQLGSRILPRLVPLVQKFADFIGKVSDWFQKLSPGTRDFLMKATAIVAIAGPFLIFFGGVARGLGAIFRAAGGAVRGIGLLRRTLGRLASSGLGQRIVSAIAGRAGLGGLVAAAKPKLDSFVGKVRGIPGRLGSFGGLFGKVGGTLGIAFGAAFVAAAATKINDLFANLTGSNLPNLGFSLPRGIGDPLNPVPKGTQHGPWDNWGNPTGGPAVRPGRPHHTPGTGSGGVHGGVTPGVGTHKIAAGPGDIHITLQPTLDGQVLWESHHRVDRKMRNRR